MKILFFDENIPYLINDVNYPVGGATIELYSWIKGLIENNVHVGILTWKGANNYVGRKLDFDIVESYKIRNNSSLLYIFNKLFDLYNAVKNFKPDCIIQECSGSATCYISIIAKIFNIPFIYRVANDMEVDDRLKKRINIIRRVFFKYGLKISSTILCQNSYQYEKMRRKYLSKNIYKIYNPYYQYKNLININSLKDRHYIAWLGVFQYQKNLPALLRIASKFNNINFQIAGVSCKNLDNETDNALEGLKKLKNVKFVGYIKRTEVISFLSNAYALLNTSRYEGFSNTFLETLAVGTPIISLGVDPDNILSKHDLGFVIAEGDINRIFNKLTNDYKYLDNGKKLQNYLKNYHDHIKLANNLKNILEEIVGN